VADNSPAFFLSFFLFFFETPPPRQPAFFLLYLFAKSVRNSLFLKRKSTQGKARVGHTNALFKCTFSLISLSFESGEATDGVLRSLFSFLPPLLPLLLLLEMKRKVKHL
jgi:hypothetical protein